MRDRRTHAAPSHPKRTRRGVAACAALLAAGVAVVTAGCGPTHGISQDAAGPVADAVSSGSASPSASVSASDLPSASDTSAATADPSTAPAASGTPTPTGGVPSTRTPTSGTPTPGSPTATVPGGPVIPVIGHTASGGRSVALTFDDGPGPFTGQILDVLAQYHVQATFCEIGRQAAADPAMVKRIVAAGHRLCDHTVDHPQPMHTLPHDKQVSEIDAAGAMITNAAGDGTRIGWFRAPGGDFTAENKQIAAQAGMKSLGWSVDTRDWSRPGTPAILAAVQQELKPGGVILMHDGGGDRSQTVAALKQLIPALTAQGYTFDFPAG
ncbi:polysaccharide deacetylase family protein [Kitasatospora sp. MAP5-34]|uniref:polysaccharide deacetylase family protein n=1 Tax=Kitasatospora sp. MAP5-34 TaxID=3035102 RepID=UPI002476D4EF|nr:polysaccharide deacetylase family protein [Kitasatospora sp. MAP5-34]MDH6577710.1 peptidoglycan/xylan/chitin deacetylase (PgdA/CDA1 family) [Kitasatospora sp. MAP5-34]